MPICLEELIRRWLIFDLDEPVLLLLERRDANEPVEVAGAAQDALGKPAGAALMTHGHILPGGGR